jgi:hypothetical protein
MSMRQTKKNLRVDGANETLYAYSNFVTATPVWTSTHLSCKCFSSISANDESNGPIIRGIASTKIICNRPETA